VSRWLRVLPIAVLGLVLAALVWRLANPEDTTIRSRLAGKPVPEFALPPAVPGKPGLASADFAKGRPRLLNVFASWCVPCIAEAPELMKLKAAGVPIDGVAINDTPEAVQKFLDRNGDPYQRIGNDKASQVQIALGSSGVPETFLIDGRGRIVRQYVSNLQPDQIDDILKTWRGMR
jgi:cytochrome c biogenesis protein CcmG/thiol:disulfide interchange protein DsbE